MASHSDPVGEAMYLSLRNALLRIEWNDLSTARRVFGCLYGLEPNGFPIIPLGVSAVSLVQSIVSGGIDFYVSVGAAKSAEGPLDFQSNGDPQTLADPA